MVEKTELRTDIISKFQIRKEGDSPRLPFGNYVGEYNGRKIKMATWDEETYNKYNIGDNVDVGLSSYKDDEKYGQSGCISYIQSSTIEKVENKYPSAEDYSVAMNDDEVKMMTEVNEELGAEVIKIKNIQKAPKEIILEDGKIYRFWNQYYQYEGAKLTLIVK